jgi:carbonic anhydrase/acetyltransferase-like protein (isoleucine patch superfamily)
MTYKYKDFKPKIKKSAWVAPSADIIGRVKIGKDSSVWYGTVIRGDVAKIKIGKRTNIQDLSMIHVHHGQPTILGDDVTIAHQVMLHGCTIGDGCLIGMSATILDGAQIGEFSIVGAKALVTSNKKFPPKSLILGNPAKVIRELTDEEVKGLLKNSKNYVGYKNNYI